MFPQQAARRIDGLLADVIERCWTLPGYEANTCTAMAGLAQLDHTWQETINAPRSLPRPMRKVSSTDTLGQ